VVANFKIGNYRRVFFLSFKTLRDLVLRVRTRFNVRSQKILEKVWGVYTSKLDIKHAARYNDRVFEFKVCFTRARYADIRGVLMRGEIHG
jgi:site-specific DNA-adenine methylase